MANFGGQRELFVAAPVGTVDTNTTATEIELKASEPMDIDLDRLVIQAGADAASEEKAPANDMVNALTLTSVKMRSGIQLIRGRNSIQAPCSVFSGVRGIPSAVNWGVWRLETGDTIVFSFVLNGTGLSTTVSLGAPCLPCNSRGPNPPRPSWNPAYTASPLATTADGTTATTLTATMDAAGLLDLDSLIIKGSIQSGTAKAQGDPENTEGNCGVTSINLPSGDALIVGQNTPSAPLQAWAPARSFTWSRFGLYAVDAGSTITVGVTPAHIDKVELSLGARFYPDSGPANRGGCY